MVIKKTFIDLYRGIDLSFRRLPLMIADSGCDGPTLWLTAAIHGDEINGTTAIHRILKRLNKINLTKGRIFAFPIMNPTGFETISRYESYDEEDLNRHFDGSNKGSVAQRHAELILQTILRTKPDMVIDLHTDSVNSIAYSIVDYPGIVTNPQPIKNSIALAKTLGFSWAIDTDKNAGYPLEKCLSGRLVSLGITAVTVELGGPRVIDNLFSSMGTEGVWKVIESLGMLGTKNYRKDEAPLKKINLFKERITSENTGIVEYMAKPGQTVEKKDILCKVKNVFGETIEIIKALEKVAVFSHEDRSITFPGQTLFTLAVERDVDDFTGIKEL